VTRTGNIGVLKILSVVGRGGGRAAHRGRDGPRGCEVHQEEDHEAEEGRQHAARQPFEVPSASTR